MRLCQCACWCIYVCHMRVHNYTHKYVFLCMYVCLCLCASVCMHMCEHVQVRVKVIQARQLQGGNIHPVTRVKVLHQTQQTRIQRSTNTPYWNQTFFYNLHISPLELLDGIIKFQVFNSKRLRADALIGAFQVRGGGGGGGERGCSWSVTSCQCDL